MFSNQLGPADYNYNQILGFRIGNVVAKNRFGRQEITVTRFRANRKILQSGEVVSLGKLLIKSELGTDFENFIAGIAQRCELLGFSTEAA